MRENIVMGLRYSNPWPGEAANALADDDVAFERGLSACSIGPLFQDARSRPHGTSAVAALSP